MNKRKVCGVARALSKMGCCSRSQAAILVHQGRVSVNGQTVYDPEAPIRISHDHIAIDGTLTVKCSAIYLMMNKLRGIVTTASDEKGRKTIYDLLEEGTPWVGAVGRLDKASEGLLLLTNDSEWAAKITDPASHLDKVYHVQINRVADENLLAKICVGCAVAGDHLRAKRATLLRHGDKTCWVEITLDEGKNRQVRRLFQAMQVGVLRLIRVSIGPLALGELAKGAVRSLTAEEKQAMDEAIACAKTRIEECARVMGGEKRQK